MAGATGRGGKPAALSVTVPSLTDPGVTHQRKPAAWRSHSLTPKAAREHWRRRGVSPARATRLTREEAGDTLIYVLRIGGKYSIFLMSSGNYIEHAIAGLRPDVALIAPLFSNNTHTFTPRLVKALNYPKIVLPTHWDDFEAPLSEPPKDLRGIYGDVANLDLWVKEMKTVSPKSRIITTKYFGSYAP